MSDEMELQYDGFGAAQPSGPAAKWIEPTWRTITLEVAHRYGLTWEEITGVSHAHRMSHPRQEAMALIYATGKLSLPAIGKRFNRDHTTVIHAIRAHAKRLAEAAEE